MKEKQEIECCCSKSCKRVFKPKYRNGIIVSKLHPNCLYNKTYNKSKTKELSNSNSKTKSSSSKKFDFYKTQAWKYFSHYILLYYANSDLVVQCATSNVWMLITDRNCHCGHYIKVRDMSKTNYSVCLEFVNAAPQSHQENRYAGGRPDVMRKWLIEKHGLEEVERIELKQYASLRPEKYWLDLMKDEWKGKYNELLNKRGIKDPWKRP